MSIIVAGIHTGVGKTLCSAVLCEALGYDYWKPVQAGDLDQSDSLFVRNHVGNPLCVIHSESYRLNTSASPHYAAELDGIVIEPHKFQLPESERSLVVETAGGLMSPLASGFLVVDLIVQLGLPVVLVSQIYLGSINHTLLSFELLRARSIPVAGLVFSGESYPAGERYIVDYTNLPVLFSIPRLNPVSADSIRDFVERTTIRI